MVRRSIEVGAAWPLLDIASYARRGPVDRAHLAQEGVAEGSNAGAGTPGSSPDSSLNLLAQRVALQVRVHLDELVRRRDLVRIRRGPQHLGNQGIGIERDRRDERIEIARRERRVDFRRGSFSGGCRSTAERDPRKHEQQTRESYRPLLGVNHRHRAYDLRPLAKQVCHGLHRGVDVIFTSLCL
jgi:hypothetical protein